VIRVDPDRLAVQTGREVADHPPALALVRVRATVQDGPDLVGGGEQHPPGGEGVDEAGQGAVGVGSPYRCLEQEHPHQGRQR
jgi:hypothetical protein